MLFILIAPFIVIFSLFLRKPKDFIFWWKWITSYTSVYILRKFIKRRFCPIDINCNNDPYKVDFISIPKEIAWESPLDESQLHDKSDEVFFYGVNSKSECLVVRVARNPNHEAEAWTYLKLNNGKVYQLKQTSGFQQSCCDKKVFSCGPLQLHYNVPMRTWRIFFNGLLSESDENDMESGKMVYVKFALRWRASSDVFDFLTDSKVSAIVHGLVRCKWRSFIPPVYKLTKSMNLYAQCGSIGGTIQIEGIEEEYNIYLFGERMRYTGDKSVIKSSKFEHVLGYTPFNGRFFHLSKISIENVVEKLPFGFVVHPIGEMCVITDENLDFTVPQGEPKEGNEIEGKFHIVGKDETYLLTGNKLNSRCSFQSKQGWDGKASISCLEFSVNSFQCIGIQIQGSLDGRIQETDSNKSSSFTQLELEVVRLNSKHCHDSSLTGGKGSSLGKLKELSYELKNFIVPSGIVVTTAAYRRFLNKNKNILDKIKHLEDVLYGNKEGDVKESCQSVSEEIIRANMLKSVEILVPDPDLFPGFKHFKNRQYAVRSSATGEDTEDMSAAGQMDTFLGVMGLSEVLSAVKKCWASQFSYIAVQYKRQNGQVINSPMAVVIQEMIPCDVAGVLFTSDPLTGNPTTMSIAANYGLGESVVSASEEPDTIELKRDSDNIVSIKSQILGAKKRRITLKVDNEGTNIEEVSEKDREKCCLSDDKALRLGNLAVQIETKYRSHRDIEWGFWNNNLYIFQSRPITTGSSETDYEIDHEFDAPMRIENEYFSMCNVGEVMPGALSTLGLDVLQKYFRIAFQRARGTWEFNFRPRYFPRGLTAMFNHMMFYCLDLFERMDENKDLNEGTLVALFGRIIEDEELFQTTRDRFGIRKKSFISGLKGFWKLSTMMYKSRTVLKTTLEDYSSYRIPVEKYKTSEELFKALLHTCTDLNAPMQCHMMNSQSSMIWNLFIFNILKKARGGISSEVYMDFAKLLTTSSDVESADVPAALDDLANHISKEKKPEDLKEMKTKEIIEWLEKTSTSAGNKYREFLQKHGHRCLKEFDIYSKTWATDPSSLINLLRNLVGNSAKNKENKETENLDKIISSLGLTFGFKARLLLKFLIPQSRRAVQNREASKSLLIKTQGEWRKAYNRLASLMLREGRIPEKDLLFFMTLDDIRDLLETRSPKIISRAIHRRKRHPILDKYIFPEIMKGFPKPVNMEENVYISSDENFSMKGIPVSQGVVKAYVRVALTIEEAAHLRPGEILLTYSTDIGWSPYFPILAGVVTELGGLISHGAVVSREYGLPCIAGLHGATRQFQTGDYVILNGNKGVLQRLPRPQQEEIL